MTRYLTGRGIKIFDFIKWASPITASIKKHAEAVAEQAGLESCTTYAPKYSPKQKAYLVAKDKKCLHYSFIYRRAVRAVLSPGADVGSVPIAVLLQPAHLAGATIEARQGSSTVCGIMRSCTPEIGLDTAEYATDVVFHRPQDLQAMYGEWVRRPAARSSTQQVSRTIKRLRLHGLVKKAGCSYRYYLTQLGRQVAGLGLLRLKQFVVLEEVTYGHGSVLSPNPERERVGEGCGL